MKKKIGAPGWLSQFSSQLSVSAWVMHDRRVVGWSPVSGSVLGVEPAGDSLSLPLCPFPCWLSHSLKKINFKKPETLDHFLSFPWLPPALCKNARLGWY